MTSTLTLVLCAILAALVAAAAATTTTSECVGDLCSTAGDSSVRVFVHVNGGNQTGTEPVLAQRVDRSADVAALALTWAAALKRTLTSGARLFSAQGRPLADLRSVRDDAHLFVVPDGEHWIWPGLYVGYRVVLSDSSAAQPLSLTTLALSPRLFEVHGLVTDAEADELVALARPRLYRAPVAASHSDQTSDVRTGSHAWFPHDAAASLTAIQERAELLTRIGNRSLYEQFQIVHYRGQQRYQSHYDYFPPELYAGENGAAFRLGQQRLATLFFYLNDVADGGETVFPFADTPGSYRDERSHIDYKDCTRGIKIKPRRGAAVLWYNTLADGHMNGVRDEASLHGACPLPNDSVEKFGANLWLRNKIVSPDEVQREVARTRERLAAAHAPPVIIDDEVIDSEPYDAKFPAAEVNPGFRFKPSVDGDGAPFVQVLRGEANWLSRSLERITIRAFLNGRSDSYVRMSTSRSPSKYEFGELADVLPVALGIAVPDAADQPCFERGPFNLYDASGARLSSTMQLRGGQSIYVLDNDEVWIWPSGSVGHVATINGTVQLHTLSLSPNLFRIDGFVGERDVAALIDAASPRLDAAPAAGFGGPAGTPSARLHRDGFLAGGRLDERIARLVHVPVGKAVDPVWTAWRVDGGAAAEGFVVPASGSFVDAIFGTRLATLFIVGGGAPSTFVFPLANAASHSAPLERGGALTQLCQAGANSKQFPGALRVDALGGQAFLLYHVHSALALESAVFDERAAFVACAQASGARWLFEKPIYLHTSQVGPPLNHPVGTVAPAYTVAQADGVFDAVPLDVAISDVAKVSVYRVGGNNTGAVAWRVAVPKSNETAALDALLRLAAVQLGFAPTPDAVDTAKYRAFNDDGFALKHTQRLQDGATLYVAPKTWHWIWPSVHVGYQREIKKVPRTEASGAHTLESLQMETLGVWPRVFVVRDFLAPHEVTWLRARGNQTINKPMNPSAAPTKPHEPSTTWLFVTEESDPVEMIEKRIAATLRIAHSEEQFEAVVVERFTEQQHRNQMEAYFDVERGHFDHMPMLQYGVNRLVGIYMLLEKARDGGDIVFPHSASEPDESADPCAPGARGGIRPDLRPGDAVIFYALHADSHVAPVPRVDRRSKHWHCTVKAGEKWGAFVFAHNKVDPTTGKVGVAASRAAVQDKQAKTTTQKK
jgi:hypothetical protein